jgi:gliding motility-associated-like protein
MRNLLFIVLATISILSCVKENSDHLNECCQAPNFLLHDSISGKIVVFPNAFSPNDDGWNDSFGVKILNTNWSTTEYIDKFELTIRDGANIVFQTNSAYFMWDGKVNGKDAPEKKYTVYLEAATADNTNYDLEGTVCLIRCIPKGFDISGCRFPSQFWFGFSEMGFDSNRAIGLSSCD